MSEQLGQRFGLEANFGFDQPSLTIADLKQGQFLGSLALNGAVGAKTGFFVEAYGTGRSALTTGATTGAYWRPTPETRLDVNAGRVLGSVAQRAATVGVVVIFKAGK